MQNQLVFQKHPCHLATILVCKINTPAGDRFLSTLCKSCMKVGFVTMTQLCFRSLVVRSLIWRVGIPVLSPILYVMLICATTVWGLLTCLKVFARSRMLIRRSCRICIRSIGHHSFTRESACHFSSLGLALLSPPCFPRKVLRVTFLFWNVGGRFFFQRGLNCASILCQSLTGCVMV